MKKPFDRNVGPENEGKNPGAGGIPLTEREKFTLRCLNAAANLYGILPIGDFCGLYNHYAKDLPAPVPDPMDEKEAERLARSIRKRVHSNRGPDMDKSLPESWYGVCDDYDTGVPQIVHELIYEDPEMYSETIDDKRGGDNPPHKCQRQVRRNLLRRHRVNVCASRIRVYEDLKESK